MRRSLRECASRHASYHGSLGQAVSGAEGAAEDSWEQQSGSEYQMDAGSDDGDSSSSMSDNWEAEDLDLEADEAQLLEGESGVGQRRGPRGGRRQVSRANSAVAPSAAATAAAAASARHIESGSEQSVYAPHSNLLWCDSALQRGALPVSRLLCTDIAGFSSNGAVAPVQVTLLIYTASWDVQQHIRSQLQLEGAAGEQQAQHTAVTDSTPVKQFGPYEATLQQCGKKNLLINHLQQQHEPETYWKYLAGKPHTVLLQERVPGPNTPHFKLHLRPGRPSQPGNKYGQAISRAGEAPGLQVAPGSVTEVKFTTAQQVVISSYPGQTYLSIPRVLACSQLPPTGSDATHTLQGVTLTVEGQGQWQANLICGRRNKHVTVQQGVNHPLSAFAGCPISKMALSQDKRLTLTLAPAAAATTITAGQAATPAAADAAAPPSPVFTESPDQPAAPAAAGETAVGAHTPNAALQAARDAAGQGLPLPTAATAGAAPLGSLARRGTPSAAVAASGRILSVLPLKRRTAGIAEPGSGQQQPESGSMAAAGMVVTAAAAAAGTSMKPVKAHGHKKVKPAGQQTPAATARVGGTEGTGAVAVAAPGGAPAPAPSTPAAAAKVHTPANMASIKREAPAGLSAQLEAPDNAVEQAAQQAAAATALASTLAARAGTPRAAPAAAAGPTPPPVNPVPIKVEAPEVMDLTADDDECIAALPSAAPAAAAAATVAPTAAGSLPAGLQLLPASTPVDIEVQLVKLLSEGLMPLLPPQQYDSIMQQLSGLFAPGRRPAIDWVRLRCRYAYVQAAVRGGRLSRVVEELQALIKACL